MFRRPAVVLVAFLAACASSPQFAPLPPPPSSPFPASTYTESPAIASLMKDARAASEAQQPANAAALLERGLRIEPRNPRLWQELSRVRLDQKEYAQAESCAQRSTSWAGGDTALRFENWQLIAKAREARGDAEGAKAALEAAERLK
ncbi:MAG TPA: tetratricopeptide repeat protein [Burkholderiales bacterium]|nr:tetratricopeptide repeat protein [Burkholderiales bacterium]